MRFFSNDAKENTDDPEHPERVQSDPVAVPQQRAGSPWSDVPAAPTDDTTDTSDAELSDQERADGTDEATDGRASFHQPGGFEASAVGAAAAANPAGRWEAADRNTVADAGDERTAPPGGMITGDATDTASATTGADADRAGDGDHDAHNLGGGRDDAVDAALADRGTFDDPQVKDERSDAAESTDETRAETVTDPTDETRADAAAGTATTYGPDGTVTTIADADAGDSDRIDENAALKDEGGFDEPTAVEPATDKPLQADTAATGTETDVDTDTGTDADAAPAMATAGGATRTAAADTTTAAGTAAMTDGASPDRDADTAAAGVPIPVPAGAPDTGTTARTEAGEAAEARPGSVTGPDLGSLFAEEDAASFHERWRDVQLRFVDDPKEATLEAARLVDEAVEKLTASLRAQREALATDSEDTERLRIELRGYRDILNRILSL